jgi:hypothetical protein
MVHRGSEYYIEKGDARNYKPGRRANLVITSPPYPSMADYTTSQRLDYYWLGYAKDYIDREKQQEIGARYLRHNTRRNAIYLDNMRVSLDNIIENIKSEGVLAIMLPEYSDGDERSGIIKSLRNYINSKMAFMHNITRNIDELNRRKICQ